MLEVLDVPDVVVDVPEVSVIVPVPIVSVDIVSVPVVIVPVSVDIAVSELVDDVIDVSVVSVVLVSVVSFLQAMNITSVSAARIVRSFLVMLRPHFELLFFVGLLRAQSSSECQLTSLSYLTVESPEENQSQEGAQEVPAKKNAPLARGVFRYS